MIPIQQQTATDEILYLAFRAAFVSTFEQLVAEHSINSKPAARCFLDRLPLANGCATQVQLDLLLHTWSKIDSNSQNLSVVDKCVCYCAADELANFGETENHHVLAKISNGPKEISGLDAMWLSSKLRTLQITWPFPVDSAVLIRDNEVLRSDLDRPAKPTSQSATDELLDVVGTWMVSPSIVSNASNLLTQAEQEELGCFFQQHPNLMNL